MKKERRHLNRRLPSLTLGSPIPTKKISRRQSQDSTNRLVTDSDLAIASSQHIQELESNLDDEGIRVDAEDEKVHSVVAYVKENKMIWE